MLFLPFLAKRKVLLRAVGRLMFLSLLAMSVLSPWAVYDRLAAQEVPAGEAAAGQEQGPKLPDAQWLCKKENGYRGIWYWNEKVDSEYVYKYSGGLGTYCAHHYPFAIHVPEVDKTFFCYGGSAPDRNELVHMVSYFDHRTGMVPRPTALLNKKTDDAHDNPVLSVDRAGHVWIFSSAHGTARCAYISVSKRPYDIDDFELVEVTNFSYPQVFYHQQLGFAFFHTRYLRGHRCLFFSLSADGRSWSPPTMLAYIEQGHYQVSAASPRKLATAFNYHPRSLGLNWRTNLYYMESLDGGATWQAADGTPLCLPLTEVVNPTLVHDYAAEDLRVYLVDLVLDSEDRPIIVYITSRGYEPGPKNDPRPWHTARWDGRHWLIRPAMISDSNYDNGSLYVESDGRWLLIAPTDPGPQPYNPGGEVVLWESLDQGNTWNRIRNLTAGSPYNHGYCRRPIRAHPQFYAFWADGHARRLSESRLYFCDREGNVYRLPPHMETDFARPELVVPGPEVLSLTEEQKTGLGGSSPSLPSRRGAGSSTEQETVGEPSGEGALPEGNMPEAGTSRRNPEVKGCSSNEDSVRPERTTLASDGDGDLGSGGATTGLPGGTLLGPELGISSEARADGAKARSSRGLPLVYEEKVSFTPDLCQTDAIFADLPDAGRNMCGPTAFANILFALEHLGYSGLVPEGSPGQARERKLLEILTGEYLRLNAQGIGPVATLEGIDRYLAERGYRCKLEWRGWRYGGRFAAGRTLEWHWLCESVFGNSWGILNVGWYRRDESSERYHRFGGHWVTLVGFRQAGDVPILLVHDPARRSGPGKVTHEVRLQQLEKGELAPWKGYPALSAQGMYRLEAIVLHPEADCALLDGAIRIEVLCPSASQ